MSEAKQTLSQDDIIDGRYTVLKLVGVGGMGEVYEVLQRRLNVHRALKILSPQFAADGAMVERFQNEAQRMAQLGKHDHIVQVFDAEYDEEKDCNYILMEYIRGQTLREVLNQLDETVKFTETTQPLASAAGLPLRRVLDIADQVADALSYMHGQQLVHRDIKPPNIMIEDDTERVVVMDLGIAKKVQEGDTGHTGTMVFTGAYASPEQFNGLKNLDHRSDIYSLGLVMAELYTGERVHPYPNREAIRTLDIGGLPEFEDLLRQAITWRPDDRYPDMQALLQAIDQCREVLPAFEQALAVRAELGNAKQQAEEKEAGHWAADLWNRAGEREAEGGQLIAARSYTKAVTAYEEARQLFGEAAQAAWAAAAPEQAERLRQEADKRGVQNWPRAAKAYRDGVAHQTQAQDGLGYEKAAASFREALDLVPQEAAQQLRDRVIGEGAQDLVPNESTATEEQWRRAEEAFDQEDYETALSAYTTVISAFELLLSLANKEKAQVACEDAQRAQEGAELAGAKIFSAQEFAEVAQRLSTGLAHAEAQDWTAALPCYTQANQEFGALQEQALEEDKRRKAKRAVRAAASAAATARNAVAAAHAQAQAASAERLVAPAWQQAVTQAESAEAVFQEAEETPAAATYTAAEAQFQAAAEFFATAAEAARLQAAHKAAQAAQGAAQHAHTQAEAAHAATLAPSDWDDAEATWGEASATFERAEEEHDAAGCTTAIAQFETATTHYEMARTAADQETARREAETAKQVAQSAKGQTETTDIRSWPQAQARVTAADEVYRQAVGHWDRAEYLQASPLYAAATQAYEEALSIATRGTQGAAAQAAQGEANRARGQAAAAQAVALAQAEWIAAGGEFGQAQTAWKAHDYTLAETQFQAATALYGEAQASAEGEAARRSAETAQRVTLAAREGAEAAHAATLAPSDWDDAEATWGEASATFRACGGGTRRSGVYDRYRPV